MPVQRIVAAMFVSLLLFAYLGTPVYARTTAPAARTAYVVYQINGNYADVLEDLRQAIIGRGMVIGAVSHVVEMLERTGKDLGQGKTIYANGEVELFCSAVLSRKAMEKDVRNIVFCPYGIAVWTELAKPGKVFVGYRRADPRGDAASLLTFREIEKLLDDIAREATRN